MQISYKFHDWSMPEDTADDSGRLSSPFLAFIKSCFNPISKHKLLHHLVLIQKVYTIQNCSFNEISVPISIPFCSAGYSVPTKIFDSTEIWKIPQSEGLQNWA